MPPARVALFVTRRNDLFAVVVAAVRAHAMRLFGAAAMTASLQRGTPELPSGAAFLAARAGMPPLGDRHRIQPPSAGRPAGRDRDSGRAAARSLVQIRATARTQSRAILATARRHGDLEQQGLAHLWREVEPPPVVKHHVIVAFELVFLTRTSRRSGSLGVLFEHRTNGGLEASQTPHAFQLGGGEQPASYRNPLAILLDAELGPDRP